jgi:opacity protein-like surface antigen
MLRQIMAGTTASSFRYIVLAALLATGGPVHAQDGDRDQWYGGHSTGFWGLSDSLGIRGTLPGMFNPPGTNAESLNAQRQYGGYRITDAFAIEGAQTSFGPNVSACNGDPLGGDPSHACNGAAWSLSGVATLPFQSGLSLYGRLGLHYWQKGFQEESGGHHNSEDPGSFGRVYGIGLSYELSKSVTFHAESEHYSELPGSNAPGPNAGFGLDSSIHSIGLSIKF